MRLLNVVGARLAQSAEVLRFSIVVRFLQGIGLVRSFGNIARKDLEVFGANMRSSAIVLAISGAEQSSS